MSGAGTASEPPAGNETSMEDILSSIRRILNDGETAPGGPDVLMLEPSMVVPEEKPVSAAIPPHAVVPADLPAAPAPARPPVMQDAAGLLAPEAAAATASSLGSLMRTLASERAGLVHRGGPTIEDVVREEVRPLLKSWLDANLPALVERVVQGEIERLLARAPPLA